MNVYIIDHQPIYMLGLKKHIEDMMGYGTVVDYEKYIEMVDFKKLEYADVLAVNISLFTEMIRQPVMRLKKINSNVKVIGLVEEDNTELMFYMDLTIFDALMLRQSIFEELKILMNFLNENKKYYTTKIVELINNRSDFKQKLFTYERN